MQSFIQKLEKEQELIRINTFVDPILEITEIADRFSKQSDGGKALLFENNGTSFPVLINAFGSERRMCMALGVNDLDEFSAQMRKIASTVLSPKKTFLSKLKTLPVLGEIASWMPKLINGKGECQEIIISNPDLSILPILQCWPADGGRFITLPLVHTKDPITGMRNVGMYRMQVFSKNTTGMHWHKHKTGARHFEEYKKLGNRMPVAVALGGHPAYTYSSTAPLPEGIDEYLLAGFLRKKRVALVKCITQELEVPADADIIIEGYVDPSEPLKTEGPFGDHTGFYSLDDQYPVFHVTCITHKKNAVYPTTIVGIPPQEDGWLGKATERIFIEPIRQTLIPELIDMNMPTAGTFHNLVIVSIEKRFAGQAIKTMNAMWGAGQMMFNKMLIVVDQHVNVHNYAKVLEAVLTNTNPQTDFIFSRGPLDVLDHSSPNFAFGNKLGIDATQKSKDEYDNAELNTYSNSTALIEWLEKNGCRCFDANNGLIISTINKSLRSVSLLKQELLSLSDIAIKHLILIDDKVDPSDLYSITWLVTANVDPQRDISIHQQGNTIFTIIDGTLKTSTSDSFPRPWPNVVASEKRTIASIDSRWDSLKIGPFIPSPSLKYISLLHGAGAVAKNPF